MKILERPQGARLRLSGPAAATVGLAFAMLSGGCSPREAERESAAPVALDDDAKRASYAVGYNVAGSISAEFGELLDDAAFVAGIGDGLAGEAQRLTESEVQGAMAALGALEAEKQATLAADNLAASQDFLARNAERPEVVSLPSGLQYEILVEGDGATPVASDTVTTHYHGTLPDGTVFDSSVERGQPASFPVSGVIAGWVEALQLMPVGSKWRLYVPPELAYGARGAGGTIGPNQVLIFDVELLGIEGAQPG